MIFKPYSIPESLRPPQDADAAADENAVRLSWLGTAGLILKYRQTVLAIDPFVSRQDFGTVGLLPLKPDRGAIERHVPQVDFIATGHSHYDHVLDVPVIAARDGATVIGSRSTAVVAKFKGLPENQVRVVPAEGGTFEAGDFTLNFVTSRHGKAIMGRVPYPGHIEESDGEPVKAKHYRHGDVYGIHVTAGGVSLYHISSADLIDENLVGLHADVVVPTVAGYHQTPDYIGRLARALSPKTVLPIHWDGFFLPFDKGLRLLPRLDMAEFIDHARNGAPDAEVILSEPLATVVVTPDGRVVRP